MVASFRMFVRGLILFAGLALAAPVADAGSRATGAAKADAKPVDSENTSREGLLIIVGIVVIVVFVAWLASRMGDNKPHVMG